MGIVCEADVACAAGDLLLPAVLALERARAPAQHRPLARELDAALASGSSGPRWRRRATPRSRGRAAGRSGRRAPARRRRPPPRPPAGATTRGPKRSHASTSRPASRAAKLDCESVSTRPPHSTRQAGGRERQGPRAPRPQQHSGEAEHDQGEEAPVDVRVEEQRVDPEVLLDLVGGDHLRVQQQRARLRTRRTRCRRTRAPARAARRSPTPAAAASTRARAARRAAARTARRRRRPARVPSWAFDEYVGLDARRARRSRPAPARATRWPSADPSPRRRAAAGRATPAPPAPMTT